MGIIKKLRIYQINVSSGRKRLKIEACCTATKCNRLPRSRLVKDTYSPRVVFCVLFIVSICSQSSNYNKNIDCICSQRNGGQWLPYTGVTRRICRILVFTHFSVYINLHVWMYAIIHVSKPNSKNNCTSRKIFRIFFQSPNHCVIYLLSRFLSFKKYIRQLASWIFVVLYAQRTWLLHY